MVAIPTVFKDCLDKKLILSGVEKIEKLPEQTITEIVLRIPDNYMPRNEKEIVVTGLNGRKQLLRKFVESNF